MADNGTEEKTDQPLVKLARRINALPDGRVLVVISKEGGEVTDWALVGAGKVERPSPKGD